MPKNELLYHIKERLFFKGLNADYYKRVMKTIWSTVRSMYIKVKKNEISWGISRRDWGITEKLVGLKLELHMQKFNSAVFTEVDKLSRRSCRDMINFFLFYL